VIDQVPVLTVVLLCLAAGVSGWIDSVVGGGGVVQLPALLIGLPSTTPVATVSGTSKLAGFVGTATATATYLPKVRISWPTVLTVIATAYAGSSLGASLIKYVPRTAYLPVIIVVVAVIGVYTWRRPKLGMTTALRHQGAAHWGVALGIGAACGLWDGLVGPGTGMFLVIGFVALLGYGFLEATTMAKVVNFATNVAALVVLGTSGHVLWRLGGCMAVCSLVASAIGSRMAIKRGNRFIRVVFLCAVVLVEASLVVEMVMEYL